MENAQNWKFHLPYLNNHNNQKRENHNSVEETIFRDFLSPQFLSKMILIVEFNHQKVT